MKYSHHFFPASSPSTIVLFLTILVLFIVFIIWLIHRKNIGSDGLTPVERKNLSSEQREVLSMLRQSGDPILQTEIVDTMPGDLDYNVEILKELEKKGLIRREWSPDKNTYLVYPL